MSVTWDFRVKAGGNWEYDDAFVSYDGEEQEASQNPIYYETQGTATTWSYEDKHQ